MVMYEIEKSMHNVLMCWSSSDWSIKNPASLSQLEEMDLILNSPFLLHAVFLGLCGILQS